MGEIMDKKYVCNGCGREFVPRDKRYAKYCSSACSSKHRAALAHGKNKLQCIQCGKEFVKRRGSNSTEGTNSFCSRKCWGAWRTDHKKTEGQSMCKVYFKACVTCGGLFTSKKTTESIAHLNVQAAFTGAKIKKIGSKKSGISTGKKIQYKRLIACVCGAGIILKHIIKTKGSVLCRAERDIEKDILETIAEGREVMMLNMSQ